MVVTKSPNLLVWAILGDVTVLNVQQDLQIIKQFRFDTAGKEFKYLTLVFITSKCTVAGGLKVKQGRIYQLILGLL